MGDRLLHLQEARSLLCSPGGKEDPSNLPAGKPPVKITCQSAVYETAAWGKIEQADYLNQALEIATFLSPQQLLAVTSAIETRMGRIRKKIWEPRIIDIDIIFYGHRIIREEKLIIPHPHLQDRRFVLTPLAEIAPDLIHPVLGKNIMELLRTCPDTLGVQRYIQKPIA
jgi:2-amino-4-hydroxy-6-hydroxymethyldihydropteridine diphosphokinase